MKSRGKSLLLCALLMLFGCGNKMTKEQRAEYDALLQQRDSIEDVRTTLIIALAVLENTHMREDPKNIEQANEEIEKFLAADNKNDSLLNDFQIRFPDLPKNPVKQKSIEINVVKVQ